MLGCGGGVLGVGENVRRGKGKVWGGEKMWGRCEKVCWGVGGGKFVGEWGEVGGDKGELRRDVGDGEKCGSMGRCWKMWGKCGKVCCNVGKCGLCAKAWGGVFGVWGEVWEVFWGGKR